MFDLLLRKGRGGGGGCVLDPLVIADNCNK